MERRKIFGALFLAVALSTPLFALASCNESVSASPFDGNLETEVETSPDGDTDGEVDGETGAETAPETPETPDTEAEEPPVAEEPIADSAAYIQCVGDSVNLRAGAGTSYAVLGSAKEGETYALLESVGDWYKTYYRGKTAYASARYFTAFTIDKSENDGVEAVLHEGYRQLGVPYVYGAVRLHDGQGKLLSGFTAQKFDCSSLVQYVFYVGANKLLQVNTRTQVLQGQFVARADLRRGDCIFFTNDSRAHLSGLERIGHVAIYLGDNYILHTSSDYARIEKMTAKRWQYYVETRRYLP